MNILNILFIQNLKTLKKVFKLLFELTYYHYRIS